MLVKSHSYRKDGTRSSYQTFSLIFQSQQRDEWPKCLLCLLLYTLLLFQRHTKYFLCFFSQQKISLDLSPKSRQSLLSVLHKPQSVHNTRHFREMVRNRVDITNTFFEEPLTSRISNKSIVFEFQKNGVSSSLENHNISDFQFQSCVAVKFRLCVHNLFEIPNILLVCELCGRFKFLCCFLKSRHSYFLDVLQVRMRTLLFLDMHVEKISLNMYRIQKDQRKYPKVFQTSSSLKRLNARWIPTLMDYIDELPVDQEEASPVEMATAQKYLNSSGANKKAKSKVTMKKTGWKDILKWSIAVTLVFLLVSNQWFDKLLGFVPSESALVLFAVKAVVFFVLTFVVLWKLV